MCGDSTWIISCSKIIIPTELIEQPKLWHCKSCGLTSRDLQFMLDTGHYQNQVTIQQNSVPPSSADFKYVKTNPPFRKKLSLPILMCQIRAHLERSGREWVLYTHIYMQNSMFVWQSWWNVFVDNGLCTNSVVDLKHSKEKHRTVLEAKQILTKHLDRHVFCLWCFYVALSDCFVLLRCLIFRLKFHLY